MPTQRLVPLRVPWQVSPSTPFLRLVAGEVFQEESTQVIFVANFGLRAERTSRQEIGSETAVRAVNPYELTNVPFKESKADSLVRISFRGGLWARFLPSYSDREVLNPQEFDVSLIPYSKPPSDVGAWLRDFQSLWLKCGNCPDPGAYTVESSEWLGRLGLKDFEHFVIHGHDSYVEVLARGWKWDEIQKLPESW